MRTNHFWKWTAWTLVACAAVVLAVRLFVPSFVQADDDERCGKLCGHHACSPFGRYKNVIFMVPDGCSQSIQTLARWYQGYDLALDSMNAGMVRTDMADSVITDSAAAATAFACGHKTTDGFMGVWPRRADRLSTFPDFPEALAYSPMATILEMAKYKGKSTGLVVTCRISHATPGAFACHVASRNWDNEITEQMVYDNLTVALGGGRRHLLPTTVPGGKRTDGENLKDVLLARGYTFVETQAELAAAPVTRDTKLWGAFHMSHMDAEIDRPIYNPNEPSLAEMTAKALEVLSQNRHGFFLMVEGSQVDWAGHNNDPIYMITDFIEFDEAVRVAVNFAADDGHTLVLAFPDHNTGGMKIGNYRFDGTNETPAGVLPDDPDPFGYTDTTVEALVNPLLGMTRTSEQVVYEASVVDGNPTDPIEPSELKDAILTHWGIEASDDHIAEIQTLGSSKVGLVYAMARVISNNYTVIGWTTHGHNGEDVPVWVYPCSPALGTIDNTLLPRACEGWGGFGPRTLDELTDILYINVEDAFPGEWVLDKTDPENHVLVVKDFARLPISKDLLIIDGKEHRLGSLVVYAPLRDDSNVNTVLEDRVYIPRAAVLKIKFWDKIKACDDDD